MEKQHDMGFFLHWHAYCNIIWTGDTSNFIDTGRFSDALPEVKTN
jgi:hypothetical protein